MTNALQNVLHQIIDRVTWVTEHVEELHADIDKFFDENPGLKGDVEAAEKGELGQTAEAAPAAPPVDTFVSPGGAAPAQVSNAAPAAEPAPVADVPVSTGTDLPPVAPVAPVTTSTVDDPAAEPVAADPADVRADNLSQPSGGPS